MSPSSVRNQQVKNEATFYVTYFYLNKVQMARFNIENMINLIIKHLKINLNNNNKIVQ